MEETTTRLHITFDTEYFPLWRFVKLAMGNAAICTYHYEMKLLPIPRLVALIEESTSNVFNIDGSEISDRQTAKIGGEIVCSVVHGIPLTVSFIWNCVLTAACPGV